jgi:hypothetical protein
VSFWRELWESFWWAFAAIALVAALVLGILGPIYLPATTVRISVIWVVVAAIVVAIALLIAWSLVAAARREAGHRVPRTRAALLLGDDPAVASASPVTLLLDRSDLFGPNLLVAIYYNEPLSEGVAESFERLIGVGKVANIQQDGRIQVLVLSELTVYAEIWQRIRRREAGILAHVVVKPSVPYGEAGVEVGFNE